MNRPKRLRNDEKRVLRALFIISLQFETIHRYVRCFS